MKYKKSDGFTIVELLVAIIVGAVIIGAATGIIVSQTHISQRGRDLIIANAYIENKIESLRSAGFAALNVGTTYITGELPSELNSPRNGSIVITSPSSAIKKILITISYNDQGTSRSYSYTTYIGELGVGQY